MTVDVLYKTYLAYCSESEFVPASALVVSFTHVPKCIICDIAMLYVRITIPCQIMKMKEFFYVILAYQND